MARAMSTIKQALRLPAEAMLKVYLAARPRPRFTPERIKRILVFAYHGLGNFIMYTPALRALRERYPEARIDLQVGNNTGCEEVLAGAASVSICSPGGSRNRYCRVVGRSGWAAWRPNGRPSRSSWRSRGA